ncbi:MAG: hypothetical protein OEZ01_14275 [Candidatus Heimdallarchaeota archaeon]|nr:hypothetical protein [Candidatus Heimdallarchaeota archaeon]MDH5647174.1 hypothetical protein [Candidatus Heimdallarchaeota archaeon]
MTRTSYTLNSAHLPYMFLMMGLIIFIIYSMLSAVVGADFMKILQIFILIFIICLIVITLSLIKKEERKKTKIEDYSLRK